jgi:hemerythrin|tara:strand:- start:147 stop:578 length:432 start_codon:yes stop_codon:yes gene_type:complete
MEIVWTSKISVYNKKIDNQHKKLLNTINNLRKEFSFGVDIRPIRQIVDFLGKYASEHLDYEEGYMKEHNFPGLARHKEIHDKFRKYYKDFKQKLQVACSSPTISAKNMRIMLTEAEKFLVEWWTNHLLKEDQKYAVYIKSHSK